MQGGPYKLLKCIRIWRSFIGDDGAIALVYPVAGLPFGGFILVYIYIIVTFKKRTCGRYCWFGCYSQAELLRVGGDDVVLAYLELMDNKIGPRGSVF
jgi:hypothetical protein